MKKISLNHDGFIDLFIGLSQAARCCRQDTAFCEGVTFHQFVILDAAAKKRGLNISDLHRILSVEKSTTTRLVNPLIQKGLLTRERSNIDSRAFVLTLTKEGRIIHRNVYACLDDFFHKVAGNLPADQKDDILQAVQLFITAVRNSAGGCDCCK
ncbi:MAG: MarR family transcriptional regulator [Smithella sp.]|jgi:DNA-binding MarR family transcriptional regulator